LVKHIRGYVVALWALIFASLAPPSTVWATTAEPPSSEAPWVISSGQSDSGLYEPRHIQKAYEKGTRSRDGKPGPNYWQNTAVHKIKVMVAPPNKRVRGEQEIIYTNNSPDPMPILIFRMYMNAHQPEAMRETPISSAFLTSGVTVEEFSVDGKAMAWDDPANPLASVNSPGSTIHGIVLPRPIPPKGSVSVKMRWSYDLVRDSGWKEGAIDDSTFFLAYFFPRVTNYSDDGGWDSKMFTMGREFNNDFADFDVEIVSPRDYVVWATGELQNASEVLQPQIAARLKESEKSDAVVTIAEASDIKSGNVTARADMLSWKWRARHVPDFAVALSNNYRWQASSVVVEPATRRRVGVQAAYADSATDFKPMVEFARQALLFGSTKYPGVPYPYPKTTIVLGGADEEYPMMVNDGSNIGNPEAANLPENAFTGFVATHEILHSWFPFYMGINEKSYPFMDEGWTTAFEYLRNREVLGAATADELFKDFRVVKVGWPEASSGNELPVITPHDSLFAQSPVFAFNQYGKAALGYLALKDLMGDDAFKKGLHTFMERWHGKRPLPWDMFNSFNDAGVGNHNWFFNNWFFGYNYMDLAISDVRTDGGSHVVKVRNPGGMAMPFDLILNYADGTSERVHRTPAAWQSDGGATDVTISNSQALSAVTLDTGIFVDFNPQDNSWKK
jgi:Peptidase family M1 domain